MVDSGASDNFISSAILKRIKRQAIMKSQHILETATLADGTTAKLTRKVLLKVDAGPFQYATHFYVMNKMPYDAILGRSFLNTANATIEYADNTVRIRRPIWAKTTEKVRIPPQSEVLIPLRVDQKLDNGTIVELSPIYTNGDNPANKLTL